MKAQPSSTSFRVPNSIVQGITTSTDTQLNRMTAVETVTLMALLSFVASDTPGKEVRVKRADILAAMKLYKACSNTVTRRWEKNSGESRQEQYTNARNSPAQYKAVQDASAVLAGLKVIIKRKEKGQKSKRLYEEPIFRELGYRYEIDGKALDVHRLPSGYERENVGTNERPLWVVYVQTPDGKRRLPCKHIYFKLNEKLADEVQGLKGSVKYTLFDRKVFALLRRLSKDPKALRLVILILRQTNESFTRVLSQLLKDLGYDMSHKKRSIQTLRDTLYQLAQIGVVKRFQIDQEADRLFIDHNKDWYQLHPREEVYSTRTPAL